MAHKKSLGNSITSLILGLQKREQTTSSQEIIVYSFMDFTSRRFDNLTVFVLTLQSSRVAHANYSNVIINTSVCDMKNPTTD